MCGIAGIVHLAGARKDEAGRLVRRMVTSLKHRGPDDDGVEAVSTNPLVVLGHARLSILDLSSAGRQPMSRESRNWIVFNGEIYNFRELRTQLERLGHVFRTQTDTEVVLCAYDAWGERAIERLRGIFALAIWDVAERRLVLARDHLGVKPLYFSHTSSLLVFSSEVRAILDTGLVERRLDPSGLRSHLAFGSIQDPYTLVSGVRSLEPGHVGVFGDRGFRTHRFWSVGQIKRFSGTRSEALERAAELLQSAVSSQLVADVPVGSFLSGGIDSSVISALAQRASGTPVTTLSIGFDERSHDESSFARSVARTIGSHHVELTLRGDDVRRGLQDALGAFDQPSVDGLNTYFVSRLAREAGLTVALSGLGGDEVFGGYDGYRHTVRAERWAARISGIPQLLRTPIASTLPLLRRQIAYRLADLLVARHHPYFLSRQLFADAEAARLLMPEARAGSTEWWPDRLKRLEGEVSSLGPVSRASALELQTYMLSTLLRDADQMSMAHGLEVRVPLIDHRLVEFVFSLPDSWRLEGNSPKPLLTESLPGLIPTECVHRPKRGFELPFERWLRESMAGPVNEYFNALSSVDAAPFTPNGLHGVVRDFQRGRLSWSRVWGVLVLRQWLRRHSVTL